MFIAGIIIGIIFFIILLAANSNGDTALLEWMIYIPLALIVFPLMIVGLCLNWRKILRGFVAPIPILSYIIQWFVGMAYAVKALVSIFKKKDLVLGKAEDNE